jgi:Fe-S cluster assembly ATP-binding protein
MLKIKNLHVEVEGKPILKGVDLEVRPGQIHAIMGPNGSGKSTLANVLAGRDGYQVTKGSVEYQGADLLSLSVEQRAHRGIFLAFQYPVEIPGVSNLYFLKAAVNAVRREQGRPELDAFDFLELAQDRMQLVGIDPSLMERFVNAGFSGGEKKRNEIFQMALLEPRLAILDETDSGLDIDALKQVAAGVNALRSPDRAMLIITHYQRLLRYIHPDQVHVYVDGKVVRSGDAALAEELERQGYTELERATPPTLEASA